MATCFLCERGVASGSHKTKRKRVFESASSSYLDILDSMGEAEFGAKISDAIPKETTNECYICYSCCNSLDSRTAYLRKADDVKKTILNHMEKYYSDSPSTSEQVVYIHVCYDILWHVLSSSRGWGLLHKTMY